MNQAAGKCDFEDTKMDCLLCLTAGSFPFLMPEEEVYNTARRMRCMFTRIQSGQYRPFSHPVRLLFGPVQNRSC